MKCDLHWSDGLKVLKDGQTDERRTLELLGSCEQKIQNGQVRWLGCI